MSTCLPCRAASVAAAAAGSVIPTTTRSAVQFRLEPGPDVTFEAVANFDRRCGINCREHALQRREAAVASRAMAEMFSRLRCRRRVELAVIVKNQIVFGQVHNSSF